MDGSLSVCTPTTSKRDVNLAAREVLESPFQFLCSATVPQISWSPSEFSGSENHTEDSLPTPEAYKTPSSINSSSPYDRAQSEISLPRRESPLALFDIKSCELCRKDFDGSEQLMQVPDLKTCFIGLTIY